MIIIDSLIHQLYQITRLISKITNRALYATNIYSSEWSILKTIHNKGTMTQTALANYLNIEPAAISKTIRQLENKELIRREVGSDKREKYIYLTDLAIQQYDEWQKIIDENGKYVLDTIDADEQIALRHILEKMNEKLNKDTHN